MADELFTPLSLSTISIDGELSNINIHEERLTPLLRTCGRIKMISSNYGSHCADGYVPPPKRKPRTSKKGRRTSSSTSSSSCGGKLVDNSILFIIALFYLSCCNPCKTA